VKVSARASTALLSASEQLTLTVEVQVAAGWHIVGPNPPLSFLVPTRLSLDETGPVVLDDVRYPKPTSWNPGFADHELPVYAGKVRLVAEAHVQEETSPGIVVLEGALAYQACTEAVCLPPAKASFSVPLRVRAGVKSP
jgi:DsbC/DsbD-like thiol-disulfide interchange protein